MTTPTDVLAAAKAWYGAGFAVIPPRQDGTKAPFANWKQYQTVAPDSDDLSEWYDRDTQYGVGLLCGQVSGNLEMLELEGRACDAESLDRIADSVATAGLTELWDELCDGYSEWTPSGGLHLLYRVDGNPVPGNTKIASRPKDPKDYTDRDRETLSRSPRAVIMETLIETRGEGGYVVVAPSQGPVHPTGNPWTLGHLAEPGKVPTITWEQRNALVAALAVLDVPKPRQEAAPLPVAPPRPMLGSQLRVGDDFNARGDWGFLESAGWTVHPRQGAPGETFWVRPGKNWTEGHSASTGYAGDADRLYVWSSATEFPTEEPISRFAAYTQIVHNGDYRAATRDLSAQGYGEQRKPATPTQQFGNLEVTMSSVNPELATLLNDQAPPPVDPDDTTAARPRRAYCQTSVGNAERMVDMFARDFRYVPDRKAWMVWNGRAWVLDAGGGHVNAANTRMTYVIKNEAEQLLAAAPEGRELKAAEALYGWFKSSQMDRGMKGTLSQFAQHRAVIASTDLFDRTTGFVNTDTGLYDLDNHTIAPHDRSHMGTKTFSGAYVPEATCPKFEKFMAEVLPDPEVRAYVRRAAGYSLLGRPDQRAIMLLHGPSGTGKSQFLEIMHGVFGDYGHTASPQALRKMDDKSSGGPNPGLHALRGKRFVSTSETSEGAVLDEDSIKRLTGTDTVRTRTLYSDEESWKPQCVVWIATNHLPRLTSTDDAIWRRVKPILFNTRFTPKASDGTMKEIPNLAAKILAEESPGILNWLLAGLKEFQEIGDLEQPEQVGTAVKEYRDDNDHVRKFWKDSQEQESVVEAPGEFIPFKNLFRAYETWCTDNRVRYPLGTINFGRRMRDLLEVDAFPKTNGVVKVPGWRWTAVNGAMGTM